MKLKKQDVSQFVEYDSNLIQYIFTDMNVFRERWIYLSEHRNNQ